MNPLLEAGRKMTRARGQKGWVDKEGKRLKQWVGYFYVYVRDPETGKEKRFRRSKVLGPASKMTKHEAEIALQTIIASQTATTLTVDETTTLTAFWPIYVRLKQEAWADRTRVTIDGAFRNHVLPEIGAIPIGKLTRPILQDFLTGLAAKELRPGKAASYSLLHKVRTHLKALLDEAVDQRVIDRNPARKLEVRAAAAVNKRNLSQDEVRRLLAAAAQSPREHLILRMATVLGLRPAELFALRLNDVEPGRLRVDEALDERNQVKSTKTAASTAYVRLPPALEAELRGWIKGQGITAPLDWVFASGTGTPVNAKNYLRRTLKRLAAAAGVPDVTFQSFRRSTATQMQRVGGLKDVQAHLRHSHASTTADVYMQPLTEQVERAVDQLDSLFSELELSK